MLPSLTSLHVDTPKRLRSEASTKDVTPLDDMLESLQPELREFVLLALAVKDCKGLNGICQVNHQFDEICKDPLFWQSALRAKGWMPDWSEPSSPGGMTPRAYFEMVCTMNEPHQAALLALRRDTTTIEAVAFDGCTSLALTHLPPNLTTIEAYAFRGCMSLALTHLPPHLTTIEERAFAGCTSLTLTHLPPNLITIEVYAFWDCTSLALTHLPPNLTTIELGAFLGCEQLFGGAFEVAVLAMNVDAFVGI